MAAQGPAPRAVDAVQYPPGAGRALPRVPDLERTELDVWQYIERENIALPSIYYTHKREVVERKGLLVPVTGLTPPRDGETVEVRDVRFRTVGDITCTCPVESTAARCRRRGDRDPGRRRQRTRRHAHGRQDFRRFDGEAQEGRVFLTHPRSSRTACRSIPPLEGATPAARRRPVPRCPTNWLRFACPAYRLNRNCHECFCCSFHRTSGRR